MCVNLVPIHHYYWGDQHYAKRLDQSARNACMPVRRVPLANHSDALVTPLGPLFTAWWAVNRQTPSGCILGAHGRIGAADALCTITLGAAYTLKLHNEIGSIECGKRADFAVLKDDPTETNDADLKELSIWGVALCGRIFPAAVI